MPLEQYRGRFVRDCIFQTSLIIINPTSFQPNVIALTNLSAGNTCIEGDGATWIFSCILHLSASLKMGEIQNVDAKSGVML